MMFSRDVSRYQHERSGYPEAVLRRMDIYTVLATQTAAEKWKTR